MGKKMDDKEKQPRVNKELKGFNIRINTFGEIISDYNLDNINSFLNKNVDDKKLRDRGNLDTAQEDSE